MPTTVAPIVPQVYVRMLELAVAATAPESGIPFRHHGIGVLQAYLTEHERVHLWHPSLRLPGMRTSGGMHDHRFAMSFGILGCHDLRGDGQPWLAIKHPAVCAKTFPDFFELLESLRQKSLAS